MASFGDRLKQLRKESNLTQQELACKFYLNKSSISRYENGTQLPEHDLLEKIADYFNVSIDYLLGRTDSKTNQNSDIDKDDFEFKTPQEAMKFILNQPAIAGYGGFEPNKMSDSEIMEFANELLHQLKLLGYKYKK